MLPKGCYSVFAMKHSNTDIQTSAQSVHTLQLTHCACTHTHTHTHTHRDHVLSVNFTVENVSSFEICAQLISHTNNHPKSRVVCIGLVGLTFRNVSNIKLDDLTLNSCGKGAVTYGPVGEYLTIAIWHVNCFRGRHHDCQLLL